MLSNAHISFIISVALIVLGFVALLAQKTYLDSVTGQPTEIKIPLAGMMKSNYPALVFVFLGFGLAIYTFTYQAKREGDESGDKVMWVLQGSFHDPENRDIDFTQGSLTFLPPDLSIKLSKEGRFEVTAQLEKGKTPEAIFEVLDYTHPSGSVHLQLKDEYQAFLKGKDSLLTKATEHTRVYKPVDLQVFDKGS